MFVNNLGNYCLNFKDAEGRVQQQNALISQLMNQRGVTIEKEQITVPIGKSNHFWS